MLNIEGVNLLEEFYLLTTEEFLLAFNLIVGGCVIRLIASEIRRLKVKIVGRLLSCGMLIIGLICLLGGTGGAIGDNTKHYTVETTSTVDWGMFNEHYVIVSEKGEGVYTVILRAYSED